VKVNFRGRYVDEVLKNIILYIQDIQKKKKRGKNIVKISKAIAGNADMGEKEVILMDYAIKSIWNDISKLCIFMILAYITETFHLFLSVCIPYITVRIFTGGIHMKTYWGCFWFTGLSMSGMMGMAVILKDYWNVVFCVTCISLLIIPIIGPRPSSNKKKMSRNKKYIFIGLIVIIELLFLFIVTKFVSCSPEYQMGILISLLINNVQLIILKSRR